MVEYRKILPSHKSRFSCGVKGFAANVPEIIIGERMFLKKVDGPRSVTLADGTVMSRADLPSEDTRRWVASRKASVVRGVVYGLITQKEALERYQISEDEFHEWVRAVSEHGEAALKATALQKYRQL